MVGGGGAVAAEPVLGLRPGESQPSTFPSCPSRTGASGESLGSRDLEGTAWGGPHVLGFWEVRGSLG